MNAEYEKLIIQITATLGLPWTPFDSTQGGLVSTACLISLTSPVPLELGY